MIGRRTLGRQRQPISTHTPLRDTSRKPRRDDGHTKPSGLHCKTGSNSLDRDGETTTPQLVRRAGQIIHQPEHDIEPGAISNALAADPDALGRFEREAQMVAGLAHPNILILHDVGRDNGVTFAVTEFLDGEPLSTAMARGNLAWVRGIEIMIAVADGLASAHGSGIVHRDLKPANIFVTRDGQVKILDFGLAVQQPFASNGGGVTALHETQPGVVLGTIGYMSPEQVNGERPDQRSDIFSLGCVLHEVATGRAPFERRTPAETLAAILRDEPTGPVPDGRAVPASVRQVIARCLHKDRDQRFQSAQDLAFALRGLLSASETAPGRDVRAPTRPAMGYALLAASALIVVAGLVWATPPGQSLPRRDETTSALPAAREAYLRGMHALEKRTQSDLREAITHFQQSVDADPVYAPAFIGMAEAYSQLGYGSYISPADSFPRARAAAERAIGRDPTLGEPHATLGFVAMYYDWNFQAAEDHYKQAIALNPKHAVAYQWYAYLLTAMERPLAEAERQITIAKELDPLSVPINTDLAFVLHYNGKNADALRAVKLALEMNPKFPPAHFWLGRIHTAEGRFEEAGAALERIGPLRTWTPAMAALGYLHGKAGRADEATKILAEFAELQRQDHYASSYTIAVIYAGLDDRERVFSYLEQAYNERSHWLVWLERDPRWNGVRGDPRFQDLVRRVGLTQ